MSNLCKTTLCSAVQNNIPSVVAACDSTDILFSTFSVDKTEPTNRISRAIFDDLPDASTVPNGHVAYLDDAKVPVIASNCSWVGFDGRTVGTFFDNQLWAWGFNNCGQLGDGTAPASVPLGRCSPVREICFATDWCQVSAGAQFSAAIKTSGELWTWGRNLGILGDGTVTTRCSPVREFCSATDWCQVSAGYLHTSAIKTSGELWSWGAGNCGNLGDGTLTNTCSPVREFCSATDWRQVSAGCESTSAIKTSGQLWVWGGNFCGIIGDGTTTQRCSPVREFCSATDWCQTSSGFRRSAAIKTSGELWVWGASITGDGTTTSRCSPVREFCSATDWCQVSRPAGSTGPSILAIKTSGQLWGWGFQSCGQLGDGTLIARCSPVREFCSATDWCQVNAGTCHTTAIKTSGELWSWGFNNCGQLGDGTHGSGGCKCSPVREFSSSTDWCQVSAGHDHSVAIKSITIVCR